MAWALRALPALWVRQVARSQVQQLAAAAAAACLLSVR